MSRSKDTDQAISSFVPDGSTPTSSIGKKVQNVKLETAEERAMQGATRVAIPEEKTSLDARGLAEEYLHRKSDVAELFRKTLKIPIRVGKMRTPKNVLGVYKINPEAIRTRVANDVSVISHEVGHHLEKKIFGSINSADVQRFKAELAPIATPGMKKRPFTGPVNVL